MGSNIHFVQFGLILGKNGLKVVGASTIAQLWYHPYHPNIEYSVDELGPQDGPDHETNFWVSLRLPWRKHLKAFTSWNIRSRTLIVAFQRFSLWARAVVCQLSITRAAAAENPTAALLMLLHQSGRGTSHGAPALQFNVFDLLPSGRWSESIKACNDRRLITFCDRFNGFTEHSNSLTDRGLLTDARYWFSCAVSSQNVTFCHVFIKWTSDVMSCSSLT